jgi:hypothetical protein
VRGHDGRIQNSERKSVSASHSRVRGYNPAVVSIGLLVLKLVGNLQRRRIVDWSMAFRLRSIDHFTTEDFLLFLRTNFNRYDTQSWGRGGQLLGNRLVVALE